MVFQPKLPLFAVLFFVFCLIALLLALPRLTPLDITILNQIHTHATPTFTHLAQAASAIGSPRTVWPLTILLAAILYVRRPRRPAYLLALTVAASGTLETIIKLAIHRPRPAVSWAYVTENSYSFPSGHATLAVALYGTLVWITLRGPHPRWQRTAALLLTVILIPTIGLTRLYLGAHHPTDILAGYITGALTLALAIAADQAL